MKINWEITLLSLIALFLGIVVYTIWSVYNFGPVKMAVAEAMREMAEALDKRAQEERERTFQGMEMFGAARSDVSEEHYRKGTN